MKLQDIDVAFCAARAAGGASRQRIVDVITASFGNLHADSGQATNIEVLRDPRSVIVIAGQQTGLYGGPAYTLCKIKSAAVVARLITQQTGIPCLPVFWIEDNDHDAAEAMTSLLHNGVGTLTRIAPWNGSDPRLRVADRSLTAEEVAVIHASSAMFTGRYSDLVKQRLHEAYAAGVSWTDAFIHVIAPYLSAWNVIPLRASKLTESGLHGPLLEHLFGINTELVSTMRNTTANIERNGDSSQASVVDVPWMYTSTTGRQRILCNQADFTIENSTYSKTALVDLIRSHPERFTPTVLTRPLLQDALLPTVASILGSAEMAYHRQLDDAYVCAGITQPFRILRSGMTLTSAKVSRYISKSGHDIHWYSRPWTGIEHDLAQELTSDVVPAVADLQHQLDQLIEPYLHAASVIDTTLIATVNAQRAGITSALESLTGKLRSAGKKKHAAIIDRARYVHSMVFPNDVLQERVFPLAMWEAEFGIDALIDLFDDIDKQAIGQHITAGPPSSQEHA